MSRNNTFPSNLFTKPKRPYLKRMESPNAPSSEQEGVREYAGIRLVVCPHTKLTVGALPDTQTAVTLGLLERFNPEWDLVYIIDALQELTKIQHLWLQHWLISPVGDDTHRLLCRERSHRVIYQTTVPCVKPSIRNLYMRRQSGILGLESDFENVKSKNWNRD